MNRNDTRRQSTVCFCFAAMANTKASGGTLIEATEWHEQSNWISSAVSSNLIWPTLWRMTAMRSTVPLPTPPFGCAPYTAIHRHATTSTQQLADICCVGCNRLPSRPGTLHTLRQTPLKLPHCPPCACNSLLWLLLSFYHLSQHIVGHKW